MPLKKNEGLSSPPNSRKVGEVLLGIIFLNAELNDFYALFSTNKAKHILNRHIFAPVVTQL